jgi:putative nucleotidyltransferase with HDIG domain
MVELPNKVRTVLDALQKAGFESYVVGGSVRDLLLNKEVHDWDFTTNATPEEIQRIFPESFYENDFGTVGLKIKNSDGETEDVFEMTPFRKEGKYSDSRHPDKIEWAKTIEEDLARRDLTINAMALTTKGLPSTDYRIIDPYSGQEDLKSKIIRAVGNPDDRFKEDALRLMRAIRIATQLGFVIEENTWNAICQNSNLISQISKERIRDELVKILSSNHPADGIKLLDNAGLLDHILPELTAGHGVTQKGTHHTDDVFDHSLNALRHCPNPNWVVRFATLLHDVGKPTAYRDRNGKATFYNHEVIGAHIARDISNRLHLSREDREKNLHACPLAHVFRFRIFVRFSDSQIYTKSGGGKHH